MYTKSALFVVLATALMPLSAMGQEPERTDSLQEEIRILKARLDSLQVVLEHLVSQGRDTAEVTDELAQLRAAAQAAAGEAEAADTSVEQQSRTRTLQSLNPEISVTGDLVGSYLAPATGEVRPTGTPREFEFAFESALDPYTRTKVFVSYEQEIEIAGYPEDEGAEDHGGVEVEEGYLYWVGLPGRLGLKAGKFRQELGLYNRWHTHALLEIDRPLPTVAFLGHDGLIQTGVSITLPSLDIGPSTQTAWIEVTQQNNDVLFGEGNQMSFLGRLQSFWDLSPSTYLQLGASGVYGKDSGDDLENRLVQLDASLRWSPTNRSIYQGFHLRGEWYWVEKNVAGIKSNGSGGYLQANYRASRRWILGLRGDYLDGLAIGDPDLYQVVPSITWWQSEWVYLRLQYNYLRPDGGSGNSTVLLQVVWAFGPHKHETY
jgi:hypothetical protein